VFHVAELRSSTSWIIWLPTSTPRPSRRFGLWSRPPWPCLCGLPQSSWGARCARHHHARRLWSSSMVAYSYDTAGPYTIGTNQCIDIGALRSHRPCHTARLSKRQDSAGPVPGKHRNEPAVIQTFSTFFCFSGYMSG